VEELLEQINKKQLLMLPWELFRFIMFELGVAKPYSYEGYKEIPAGEEYTFTIEVPDGYICVRCISKFEVSFNGVMSVEFKADGETVYENPSVTNMAGEIGCDWGRRVTAETDRQVIVKNNDTVPRTFWWHHVGTLVKESFYRDYLYPFWEKAFRDGTGYLVGVL